MRVALAIWLLSPLYIVPLLAVLPGRESANAHPEVRGGGDYGFGGLDHYERTP